MKTVIERLDDAQRDVRNHIAKCGSIATMSEGDFLILKELNAKVSSCQNKAFNYHTVGIKS